MQENWRGTLTGRQTKIPRRGRVSLIKRQTGMPKRWRMRLTRRAQRPWKENERGALHVASIRGKYTYYMVIYFEKDI